MLDWGSLCPLPYPFWPALSSEPLTLVLSPCSGTQLILANPAHSQLISDECLGACDLLSVCRGISWEETDISTPLYSLVSNGELGTDLVSV